MFYNCRKKISVKKLFFFLNDTLYFGNFFLIFDNIPGKYKNTNMHLSFYFPYL